MSTREWKPVTRNNPCPACGRPDWCAWTRKGWLKCERSAEPPPGMVLVSAKDEGGVFRPVEEDHARRRRSTSKRDPLRTARSPSTPEPDGGPTFATAREAVAEMEKRHGPRSALWEYRDVKGELAGVIVRWDLAPKTPGGKPGKAIRPASKIGAAWMPRGMPEPRPLYALPEVLATEPGDRIFITEGEKAADALRAVGLTATTSPHGAKSAAKADWFPLADRDVVILPDNDPVGETYARDVARLAHAAGARSVRIVKLPWLGPGEDAFDYAARRREDGKGNDEIRADFERLAGAAPSIAPEPAAPEPGVSVPVLLSLADVKPERVRWLWTGRIALGKVSMIVGDPGLGKSLVTLDLTARVSSGCGWPDAPTSGASDVPGARGQPGGVVLLSAEDDAADTIRPRLDAAGADVSRITVLTAVRTVDHASGRESERMFSLADDLAALEAAIDRTPGCRLVIVDPISAYLGGTDSHKNADVRALLAPLGALAARKGVAIVAVSHLNKSGGGSAIYRTTGSLAFPAASRAAWAVARDRDDPERRLFLPLKNNLGPDAGGLAFRVIVGPGAYCPTIRWEDGPVSVSADDALAANHGNAGGGERTERDDAADFLREQLAHGPKPVREVEDEARAAGIRPATLKRARATMGVKARKSAFGGGWMLHLPRQGDHEAAHEEAHPLPGDPLRAQPDENPEFHAKGINPNGVSLFGGSGGEGEPLGHGEAASPSYHQYGA